MPKSRSFIIYKSLSFGSQLIINSPLEMAKKYPPSLRIVVVETNLDKIDVGKLFLVTYKGGSLGREGTHDVLIPDINISKVIYFNLFFWIFL